MTLELRNVTKILQGRPVVDDVSFRVEDGEFFVLLGTSGSGKSTLLRIIAGLEKPDRGTIWLNGKDITNLPSRERNLGMVFQDYGLYPNMNVYQNIAYGLEARGVKRAEVDHRVKSAANKLQIEHHLKRSISDLSGGEQQRVALARALAKDAAAYLFDEPLSNLDPKLRLSARQDIQEVHRLKRKPSLYVTHDQIEAFALADRIGILSQGRMQQIGTAEILMNYPANTFVASFLGAVPINLIAGDIQQESIGYRLWLGQSSFLLETRWTPILDRYNKQKIIAGIRPNALSLTASAQPNPSTLTGKIEAVEELLNEVIVVLQLDGKGHATAVLGDADAGQFAGQFAAGGALTLHIDTDQLLLFDFDTNMALSGTAAPAF
ncbi:MAG: ABC transporter ATP-binding protein [bacterium]|nr:ABC transporter ATP-binding protein [bacterium]